MKNTALSKWGTVLFHLVLVFGVLAMISSSFTFTERARLLPLMIGVPTAVLLVLSLVRELKPDLVLRFQTWMDIFCRESTDKKAPSGFSSIVEQEVPPLRSFFTGAAWFCLLLVLILFVGFLAATLIFIPTFLLVFARYRWWRVALYTAILFLVEWYGFEVLLGLKLWHGFMPEIVPGFIGGGVLPRLF